MERAGIHQSVKRSATSIERNSVSCLPRKCERRISISARRSVRSRILRRARVFARVIFLSASPLAVSSYRKPAVYTAGRGGEQDCTASLARDGAISFASGYPRDVVSSSISSSSSSLPLVASPCSVRFYSCLSLLPLFYFSSHIIWLMCRDTTIATRPELPRGATKIKCSRVETFTVSAVCFAKLLTIREKHRSPRCRTCDVAENSRGISSRARAKSKSRIRVRRHRVFFILTSLERPASPGSSCVSAFLRAK